jgi:hypothetical protein
MAIEIPIACTLAPTDAADRLTRWRTLAEKASPEVTRDRTTLTVRYDEHAGVADEIAALAAAETDCCGFVSWTVDGTVLIIASRQEDPTAIDAIEPLFR